MKEERRNIGGKEKHEVKQKKESSRTKEQEKNKIRKQYGRGKEINECKNQYSEDMKAEGIDRRRERYAIDERGKRKRKLREE